MTYEPQIIVVSSRNVPRELVVLDPSLKFAEMLKTPSTHTTTRMLSYRKLLNDSNIPVRIIDNLYIFDSMKLNEVHMLLQRNNVVATDVPYVLYSYEYNIDVSTGSAIYHPNMDPNVNVMRATPPDTTMSKLVPYLYKGVVFEIAVNIPKPVANVAVSAHSTSEPIQSTNIYTDYLNRIKYITFPDFEREIDLDVVVVSNIEYLLTEDIVRIYTDCISGGIFTPQYIIFKRDGRYFFSNSAVGGGGYTTLTKFDELQTTQQLTDNMTLIQFDKFVLANDRIMYTNTHFDYVLEFIKTYDIGKATTVSDNDIKFAIKSNYILNVNNINNLLETSEIFLKRTKSYNLYQSSTDTFTLIVSKSRITMSRYRIYHNDISFVRHLISYLTYCSLEANAQALESKLPNIDGVYWSKICQNTKSIIRKPVELKTVPDGFTPVEDSSGKYWTKDGNPIDVIVKLDTKYFRCTDSVYPHLGFLKKLQETFGYCRPCCFKKPFTGTSIFTKCTRGHDGGDLREMTSLHDFTSDDIVTGERRDVSKVVAGGRSFSPYILNNRVFVGKDKLSMLEDVPNYYLNDVFMQNTFKVVSSRLVETDGFFFVGHRNINQTQLNEGLIKNVLVFYSDGIVKMCNIDASTHNINISVNRKNVYNEIVYAQKSTSSDKILNILTRDIIVRIIFSLFGTHLKFMSINSDLIHILNMRDGVGRTQPASIQNNYQFHQLIPSTKVDKIQIERLDPYTYKYIIPSKWVKSKPASGSKAIDNLRSIDTNTQHLRFFNNINQIVDNREILSTANLVTHFIYHLLKDSTPFDDIDNFSHQFSSLINATYNLCDIDNLKTHLTKLNTLLNTSIGIKIITSKDRLTAESQSQQANDILIYNNRFYNNTSY